MSKKLFGGGGGGFNPITLGAENILGALTGGGGRSSGVAMPAVASPAPPRAASEQPAPTNFARPGEMSPPTFAGFNSGMSPEQQLTRSATLLTQGQFGHFARPTTGPYAGQGAADAVKAYYKNLALRQYTDPSGNVLAGINPSDIEWQAAEQLGGPQKDRTLARYLQILSGLA